jgi:hypothetical protein
MPLRSALLLLLLLPATAGRIAAAAVSIEKTEFQGWPDALRLRSAHAEAIVVPAVTRVMSFRLAGGENVFWTDRALDGRTSSAERKSWVNFGGDKSWPAPEAEWGRYTGNKSWLPPAAFDALPAEARIKGDAVYLVSPVDPHYGIRVTRRIALQAEAATMTIETEYERVAGAPSRIGIWVITQLRDPVAVYVPVPTASRFPDGHFVFGDKPWPQLARRGDLLEVTRDPATSHKLGSDADRMLWVGRDAVCLISSPRVAGEYPDRGASAEVYTNPDPKTYVELETLGPLAELGPGARIRQTNTYTLWPRRETDPRSEAARHLGTGK